MKAYRWQKADSFVVEDVPVPDPGPNEVLVQVKAAGLCHSDIHIIKGHLSSGAFPVIAPLTLGHEVAGTIVKLGSGVSNLQVGDDVAIAQVGYPKEETAWDTSVGLGSDGGYAEFVKATTNYVVKIPAGVPLHHAAVATDSIATAYHAVMAEAKAGPGVTVGIVGLGGLGLNGVIAAEIAGAKVYGFDLDTGKFENALSCGATACYKNLTDAKDVEFDAIVDFAGVGVTTAMAIEAVRVGGTVVLVGLGVDKATLPTAQLTMKSVYLKGCMGASLKEYEEILDLIAAGRIKPVTTEVPFSGVKEGLDQLEGGKVSGRLWTNPSAGK